MYKKETEGLLKHYDFVLLDMICLQLALILAHALRGHGFNIYASLLYRNTAIFIELANIILIFFLEPFKNVVKRGYYQELLKTMRHAVTVGCALVLYLFLTQGAQQYSRIIFILMMIIYTVMTYVVRVIWKYNLRKKMNVGGERSMLIITTEDVAADVIQNMMEHNYARYKISGLVILDKESNVQEIEGISVVADEESVAKYVCNHWIDEVLIIPSDTNIISREMMEELVTTGVTVHFNLKAVTKSATGRKQFVEKVGNYTVLSTSINYASSRQLFLKRTMDIAGGIVGCILTGIIFFCVAPVIYINSPGPIFFSQERVGKNGKTFKMYKFRSMYLDAEERKAELMKDNKLGDAKMFKLDFDPRVIGNKILPDGTKKTGIGNFLRTSSLDEFPQFFNVLKGDMSIVGTRPPLVGEVSEYELRHRARLAIKPGITGMWQVSGRSDIIDFENVVKLDTKYISEWSLGLDIKILFKTIKVVLGGVGAK